MLLRRLLILRLPSEASKGMGMNITNRHIFLPITILLQPNVANEAINRMFPQRIRLNKKNETLLLPIATCFYQITINHDRQRKRD